MSNKYLGIDTSNYTSSCAIYDSANNTVDSLKKLLPVAAGQMGLRQSDAVFHHTKNLPTMLASLCEKYRSDIDVVSVSFAPRDAEGSYMPCFLVGEGYSDVLSSAFNAKNTDFLTRQVTLLQRYGQADKLILSRMSLLHFMFQAEQQMCCM